MLFTLLEVTTIPTEPATSGTALDFTFLFIKMIAALVVAVVAAILVLRYAVPKLGLSKRFTASKDIEIISRTALGPKQYLYLVKVTGKCILLGVTDHSINKISDVTTEGCHPELKAKDLMYEKT